MNYIMITNIQVMSEKNTDYFMQTEYTYDISIDNIDIKALMKLKRKYLLQYIN